MYMKKGDCYTVRTPPELGLQVLNPCLPHQIFLATKSAHDQFFVIFFPSRKGSHKLFLRNKTLGLWKRQLTLGKKKKKTCKRFQQGLTAGY